MNKPAAPKAAGSPDNVGAQKARARNHVIRSHTGLRGIAALLVVAYHQQLGGAYKLPVETATGLFRRSYLMVDLFFVLSGFIISYVYNADRESAFKTPEIKAFLVARFARIYPLHLFALLFLTVVTLAITAFLTATGHLYPRASSNELRDWFVQLVLLNAWIRTPDPWNVPSWSISAELFAYLLFPVVVLAHMRRALATSVCILAIAFIFYIYVVAARNGSLDITVGLAPVRCIAGFGLGMLLYFWRAVPANASEPVLSAIQLCAACWIVLTLAIKVPDPLIIPAFLLLIGATWTDRGHVAQLLAARPLQWLGDISYSVYLMHVPLGTSLWFLWSHVERRLGFSAAIDRLIWLCLIFSVVLVVSTLTYGFIEVPARRTLLSWWGRRKAPPGDAAVAAP